MDTEHLLARHGLMVIPVKEYKRLKRKTALAYARAADYKAWAYQIIVDLTEDHGWASRKIQTRDRAIAHFKRIAEHYR